MGQTMIDCYTITPEGRARLRASLEEHHDDVWICKRSDVDDVGVEHQTYYLELTREEFEAGKWWGIARVELASPHR